MEEITLDNGMVVRIDGAATYRHDDGATFYAYTRPERSRLAGSAAIGAYDGGVSFTRPVDHAWRVLLVSDTGKIEDARILDRKVVEGRDLSTARRLWAGEPAEAR